MGAEKAALVLEGVPLIERVWSLVAPVSEHVVVVGGDAELARIGVEMVPDRYPGADSMGGIATALAYAEETAGPDASVLCVACDMPFLVPALLLYMNGLMPGFDVVVPRTAPGYEPLCALYRASCLPVFVNEIRQGNLRVRGIFGKVRTREVSEEELRKIDPDLRSFLNLNRPADLQAAERMLRPKQDLDSREPGFL
jgi:molybdopterin-guanine dinucleotide biosynthesis protein A